MAISALGGLAGGQGSGIREDLQSFQKPMLLKYSQLGQVKEHLLVLIAHLMFTTSG